MKTVVPFLSGEEMKKQLSMPDPSTRKGLRDMVLMAVLYDSATRVQEIIDLPQGKGRYRQRFIPFLIQLPGHIQLGFIVGYSVYYFRGLKFPSDQRGQSEV